MNKDSLWLHQKRGEKNKACASSGGWWGVLDRIQSRWPSSLQRNKLIFSLPVLTGSSTKKELLCFSSHRCDLTYCIFLVFGILTFFNLQIKPLSTNWYTHLTGSMYLDMVGLGCFYTSLSQAWKSLCKLASALYNTARAEIRKRENNKLSKLVIGCATLKSADFLLH